MEIVIRYPKTKKGKAAFKKRLAAAHIELIKTYITNLNITDTEKIDLFNKVKNNINKMSGGLTWICGIILSFVENFYFYFLL